MLQIKNSVSDPVKHKLFAFSKSMQTLMAQIIFVASCACLNVCTSITKN